MRKISFAKYAILERCLTADVVEAFANAPKPAKVGGKALPDDLTALTLGNLAEIQRGEVVDALGLVCGAKPAKLMREDAFKVVGAFLWLKAEFLKVADLFKRATVKPTAEEQQAAFGMPDYGLFAVADWYALRMGLHTHDEALDTKWTEVLMCKRIEASAEEYRRRLRDIHENKIKK